MSEVLAIMLPMRPTGHGSFPPKDVIPDTVNGFKYVRDLYVKSNDTSGTWHLKLSPSAEHGSSSAG